MFNNYLLSFDKRRLAQTGEKDIDGIKGFNARKKTANKWFETQDQINYSEILLFVLNYLDLVEICL